MLINRMLGKCKNLSAEHSFCLRIIAFLFLGYRSVIFCRCLSCRNLPLDLAATQSALYQVSNSDVMVVRPMSSGGMRVQIKRMVVLAVMLAALAFVFGGQAEAATHDHQAAAMPAMEHAAHQAQPPVAADDGAQHAQHQDDGVHHGGNCHCVSATCASVLPPHILGYKALQLRPRHDRPQSQDALALAGVAPPAEPPRL